MERFSTANRLRNSAEFDAVFRKTDFRVSARHFLFLARSNELDHARLGLVVARRAIPLAVQRNRVKRLIRESFRRVSSVLPPCDVVVVCRSGSDKLDNSSIEREVTGIWRQLKDRTG